MDLLLRKTKELEQQIDQYLDTVVNGALVFKTGLRYYLDGSHDLFVEHMHRLDALESTGDSLRREIETRLYAETLIPEFRGDVLGLLESSDKVLNRLENTIAQFAIEKPDILDELKPLFANLVSAATLSVEEMVVAVRAYFREPEKVRDSINKVIFYEKETDDLGDKIITDLFASSMDLSRKMHIRYFASHIEQIADEAEDVCDRLAIAAIKRHI
jgi:predicted phosphate transport protein (TIGR00153 family)